MYNQPTQPQPKPRKHLTKRQKFALISFCSALAFFTCICTLTANAGKSTSSNTSQVTQNTSSTVPSRAPTQAPKPTPMPTHKLAPTATPTHAVIAVIQPTTPPPAPTKPAAPVQPAPTPCIGVNNNPWCYDFNPGNEISDPPATFCDYFSCVSTFWKDTNGTVAECANGKYTHSYGVSGACSRDGGVAHVLYSH